MHERACARAHTHMPASVYARHIQIMFMSIYAHVISTCILMSVCIHVSDLCMHSQTRVCMVHIDTDMEYVCEIKPLAFELAGKETEPSSFPGKRNRTELISRSTTFGFHIIVSQTANSNGKSSRLSFLSGKPERKHIYMSTGYM
jgi:hypothetical protein